ncbi:MAG: tail fiber domain-containing protein [Candidatus Saccharimonadales bacterium]
MKRFSKLFACVGLIGLLLSGSLSVVFTAHAKAAGNITWVNQATVTYNGSNFKESDAGDYYWEFKEQNAKDGCADIIDGVNYDSTQGPYKTQSVNYKPNSPAKGGGCTFGSTRGITLSASPANFNIAFVWQDDSNILSADGKKTFSKQKDGTFRSASDGACADYLQLGNGGSKTNLKMVVRSNQGTGDDATTSLQNKYEDDRGSSGWPFVRSINSDGKDPTINSTDCHESKPFDVQADADNSNAKGTPAGSAGTGANSTNGGSCESIGGALSWIACPVIDLMSSTIDAIDNAIQNQLRTPDPNTLIGSRNGVSANTLKTSWGRLRNIALVVLVPIMLVMVIGTAIGFSGLDAYTVKRAMPRLLIAVIFISLSWYITTFLVQVTNVVGAGVYGLMTQPFGLANKSLADMISGVSGGVLSWTVIVGVAAAGLAQLFTIGIVFSLVLTAALAIFIGFCILTLRNVFIYAMILLAPLAILAWIFPNNDKLWKLWWGTFSKLLMMYPMIMALIASGKIFASVVPLEQNGSSGLFTNAAVIVAYIAPYFFIPATFKFAGGAFANIAGMVNDRGRGAFDRLKKGRQEARAQGWRDFKAGDGRGRLRKSAFVRRTGLGVGAGWSGHYGFGERGRQKIGGLVQTNGDAYLKDRPDAAKVFVAQDDTAAVMGLSGGTVGGAQIARDQLIEQWVAGGQSRADATARGNRAFQSAMALGVSSSAAAGALSIMSQNKSRAIAAGNYQIVQDGISRLAGGNAQLAQDLSYNYQYNSRGAMRVDLGGDWTSGDVESIQLDGVDANGHAIMGPRTVAARRRQVFYDGVKRTGTQELVRGYTASTEQAIQTINDDFASGDLTRMLDAAALTAEMQGNLTQASGENRDRIAGMLSGLGISTDGDPEFIERQLVARLNAGGAAITHAELSNYVRNWSRTTPTGAAAGAAGAGGGGAPPPPPPPPSDRRLKDDIKYIKTLDNGVRIYSFRYLWSNQYYVGVMAQDLLQSHPETIVSNKYGYYAVHYDQLGLRMITLEEWLAGEGVELDKSDKVLQA